MNAKIVFVLVAAAFIAGMMVQAIPAEAEQKDCKKNETSSCWIRVAQLFETTTKKLQAINKHFDAPVPAEFSLPPDDKVPILKGLLADLKTEIEEVQMNQSDWEFLLERAR